MEGNEAHANICCMIPSEGAKGFLGATRIVHLYLSGPSAVAMGGPGFAKN